MQPENKITKLAFEAKPASLRPSHLAYCTHLQEIYPWSTQATQNRPHQTPQHIASYPHKPYTSNRILQMLDSGLMKLLNLSN